MSQYMLSKNAYICVHGDELVVLDLQKGTYNALTLAQAGSLAHEVADWPIARSSAADPELLRDLIVLGMLTSDPQQGKRATPIHVNKPSRMLGDLSARHPAPPSIRVHHVTNFLRALLYALWTLRFTKLRHVTERVRRRKAAAAGCEADHTKLLELTSIFARLRAFAYDPHGACLLHSLALLEFLARYQVHPQWVFGVRTAPFYAHCWLQLDEVSITDNLSHIDGLTPIMAV